MIFRFLFFPVIVIASLSTPLFAQIEECTKDNLDACRVDTNVYCLREGTVPLNVSITDDLKLQFTLTFTDAPPANKLVLYFVDGEVEEGIANEVKAVELNCGSQICQGNLVAETKEEIEELEEKFDFTQAFTNIAVRLRGRNGKDLCLAKFANNPELIRQNDASKRVICSVEPTEGNELISGKGYFSPGGYGADGESFFHLNIQGLDPEIEYNGCSIIGADRYRKVFTFNPVTRGVSDQSIYGTLTPKEAKEFNSKPADLSYDLYWQIFGSADSVFGAFTPSLSLINKGVSPSRAESSTRDSNKKTRARRKARKRRRREQGKRSLALDARSDAPALRSVRAPAEKEKVLAWLNFDPLLGGELLISTTCGPNAASRAIGRIVCGEQAEDEVNRCVSITDGEDGVGGTTCREVEESVGELTIRVKGISTGSYTICLNDTAIHSELVVNESSDSTFGELKLTDNATLATGDSSYQLIQQTVSGVTSVKLSRAGTCGASIGTFTF